MAKLEYRLYDEENSFPALFCFEYIPKEEIAVRFACDYFTKEGVVYEKISSATEPELSVIYVKPTQDEKPLSNNSHSSLNMGLVVLEVREFHDYSKHYPIIQSFKFNGLIDVLLYIQGDFVTLNGVEWAKSSVEVDEDRQVYVLYVKRPG